MGRQARTLRKVDQHRMGGCVCTARDRRKPPAHEAGTAGRTPARGGTDGETPESVPPEWIPFK